MQDPGEDRRQRGLNAVGTRAPSPLPRGPRAGEIVARNVVTLPAWFPARKALAVLRLKKVDFALLSDARGAQAVALAEDLAAASPERPLSGCATALGPAISAQLPIDEVLSFMNRHAALHVPVLLGGVVLGLLSHAAAADAVAPHHHAALPLAA
jgi:CBS domain-containing protein